MKKKSKKQIFSVALDPEIVQMIYKIAEIDDITPTCLARKCINTVINNKMKELGLYLSNDKSDEVKNYELAMQAS